MLYHGIPWYSPVGNEVYHDPSHGWMAAEDTFVVDALHPELMERFDSPMGALGKGEWDLGETPWKMYNPNVLMINIYQGILRYIWIC